MVMRVSPLWWVEKWAKQTRQQNMGGLPLARERAWCMKEKSRCRRHIRSAPLPSFLNRHKTRGGHQPAGPNTASATNIRKTVSPHADIDCAGPRPWR